MSPKLNLGVVKEIVASASVVFGGSDMAAGGAAGCDDAAGTPKENAGADVDAAGLSPPTWHQQQDVSNNSDIRPKFWPLNISKDCLL